MLWVEGSNNLKLQFFVTVIMSLMIAVIVPFLLLLSAALSSLLSSLDRTATSLAVGIDKVGHSFGSAVAIIVDRVFLYRQRDRESE